MSIAQPDNSTSVFVAPISCFSSRDLGLAGGKGANLGELSRAGFDVPPGFVIATSAYDLLLQSDSLQTRLTALLTSLSVENADSVKEVSQHIRDILQETNVPGQIRDEILNAYRELKNGALRP